MRTLVNRIFRWRNGIEQSNLPRSLKNPEAIDQSKLPKPSAGPEAVYQSFIDGLDRMETEGVDRVILTLHEAEPRPNPNASEWILPEEIPRYYPFEVLEESEQKMILEGKTYVVDSLVRNDVGGFVKYKDKGIERYHRTHGIPVFLQRLKPEANLNYFTEGGMIATGEGGVRKFAEDAAMGGWNPEALERVVDVGIPEYHKVTRRLMESAGVYNALERMESEQSPFERLMYGVRERIDSAKKKI